MIGPAQLMNMIQIGGMMTLDNVIDIVLGILAVQLLLADTAIVVGVLAGIKYLRGR